jgi:hypothetical protein
MLSPTVSRWPLENGSASRILERTRSKLPGIWSDQLDQNTVVDTKLRTPSWTVFSRITSENTRQHQHAHRRVDDQLCTDPTKHSRQRADPALDGVLEIPL